nr:PREDICTED: cysteine-rich protein 1 isoform X1 [Equus przewalskii]
MPKCPKCSKEVYFGERGPDHPDPSGPNRGAPRGPTRKHAHGRPSRAAQVERGPPGTLELRPGNRHLRPARSRLGVRSEPQRLMALQLRGFGVSLPSLSG